MQLTDGVPAGNITSTERCHRSIIMNTIPSPPKAANSTVLNGYEKSSEEMHFNMLGKRSAADYTQIGHGITDGALQGMDVSKA